MYRRPTSRLFIIKFTEGGLTSVVLKLRSNISGRQNKKKINKKKILYKAHVKILTVPFSTNISYFFLKNIYTKK
jgi:hypothetical protein